MNKTRTIVFIGLFLALGIITPQAFHLFGGTGPVFLPMHIPVLLGGLFLGGPSGLILGILTPILSSALTGMPQVPITYFMICELAAYGFFAGFFYRKIKLNVVVSLILAMVSGRIVLALVVFTLQALLSLKLSPTVYLSGAVVNGLPGMLLQLFFIPFIVKTIEKAGVLPNESTQYRSIS